jgi:hypothetical protein
MEAAPGTPPGAAPRGLIEEDAMQPRRWRHTIRQIEPIGPKCWAVSTQTEDGHRLSAFGLTRQQAISRVHQKAKAYGRYAYPTAAAHEKRDGSGEPATATIEQPSTASAPMTCPRKGETTWPTSL